MDQENLEDNIKTLYHDNCNYPEIETADKKQIKAQDIARMHQVEQVGALFVKAVDLFEYTKQG